METNNLNLCELLKGHEGETFYSPLTQRNITLKKANKMLVFEEYLISLDDKGAFYPNGECMVFPSKEQRDWNKWAEGQKPKVPKIFDEIPLAERDYFIRNIPNFELSKIQKSAMALLKIHQLIEVGYGGNVTNKEWADSNMLKYVINRDCYNINPNCDMTSHFYSHIAFHTERQRNEFLYYDENVKLIRDFYMK